MRAIFSLLPSCVGVGALAAFGVFDTTDVSTVPRGGDGFPTSAAWLRPRIPALYIMVFYIVAHHLMVRYI